MLSARRLLAIGLAATLLVVLVVFGLAGKHIGQGRIAPALPSAQLVGPRLTLAELRGSPVLVVFWASWCAPCALEAPALERFSRDLGGRARLIGVNSSDVSISDARSFIRHYHWTFPNLRDAEGLVGNRYGLIDLPTTFLIDSRGRIRQTLRGPQTEQTLNHALSELTSS